MNMSQYVHCGAHSRTVSRGKGGPRSLRSYPDGRMCGSGSGCGGGGV